MVFFRESKRLDQKLKVCVNTGEGERRVVDCWKLFLFFFFVKCVSGRSSRLWFYFFIISPEREWRANQWSGKMDRS